MLEIFFALPQETEILYKKNCKRLFNGKLRHLFALRWWHFIRTLPSTSASSIRQSQSLSLKYKERNWISISNGCKAFRRESQVEHFSTSHSIWSKCNTFPILASWFNNSWHRLGDLRTIFSFLLRLHVFGGVIYNKTLHLRIVLAMPPTQ